MEFNTSENTNSGANTSTVNWSFYLKCSSGSAYNNNNNAWYVQIDGSTRASGNSTYSLSAGGSKLLSSGTSQSINHNTDGSKSINVKAYYDENGDTISETMVLTDYVRVPSAVSSVSTSVNGNVITVSWPDASAPFGPITYHYANRYSTDGGSTWSNWSGESTTTSTSFTGTYTAGRTYQFYVYPSNGDGNGGTTYSNPVFLAAGGKRFTTTSPSSLVLMQTKKRYTSSGWVDITVRKRWDGNNWVNLS